MPRAAPPGGAAHCCCFGLPSDRGFSARCRAGTAVAAAAARARLKAKVPRSAAPPGAWPAPRHARKMLALGGCVQPALAPSINAAAARVLDRFGISLVEAPGAGCCGGVRFHLNYQQDGRDDMRALIDAWWPLVERGEVEAIVMTASGCGVDGEGLRPPAAPTIRLTATRPRASPR